jgi:uncharacterized protein YraI
MILRPLAAAGSVAAALFASTIAMAAPGVATGDVNMRTGPGTGYSIITTIPAGAPIEIYSCSRWCEVNYAGAQGYVSANYVSADGASAPYTTAPVYGGYYDGFYGYAPSIYFSFGGYGYDGYYDHRWRGGDRRGRSNAWWWRNRGGFGRNMPREGSRGRQGG